SMCGDDRRGSLSQGIEDSAIVYGHLMLPGGLRAQLPDIDHSWGNFDDDASGVSARPEFSASAAYSRWRGLGAERSAWGQSQVLRERARAITAEPAVHLIHVALPHIPWKLNRSGLITMDFPPVRPRDQAAYAEYAQLGYQLHAMQ